MDSKIITKYVYAFSPDNEPVERAKRGETLKFKTLDCFSNQIKSEEQLITIIDFNHVNPATGPVYVEGAKQAAKSLRYILSDFWRPAFLNKKIGIFPK